MPYPTAIVEIAFGSSPYVASPAWTDVSAYVREITTRRGRSDPFQDFGSGSATIILDNRDRRFDPLNAASPYAGQLLPRKQIRVRATNTVSGITTTYDVFRGYVSGWPVTITEAGFDSTVTVECFDALGLLATEEIPDDLADNYIRSLNPRHYWPLTDPIDPETYTTTQLVDYGNTPQTLRALAAPIRTANSSGLAEGLPDTSTLVAETANSGWGFISIDNTPTDATFAIWSFSNVQTTATIALFGSPYRTTIRYAAGTSALAIQIFDGVVRRDYAATIDLDTTIAHHYVAQVSSTGTLNAVYIDGQIVTTTGPTTTSRSQLLFEEFATFGGQKQQAVMWDRYLTAAEIQTIYRLSRNILTETSAARMTRIMSFTSFPGTQFSAPSSPVANVGAFTTGGPAIANELEVVSDSEGGNLYVTKNGTVKMTSRQDFATGTSLTSQATIGTTGITIGTTLDYRIDADLMRNQLAIGYSGSGSIEITNQASVDTYGVSGGSITTELISQDDARNLGTFIIGFTKEPTVAISPVEVNVSAVAADWATVLGLELLDRYTLTVQPKTGSSFTMPQLIQSIEHRVIPGQWSTTLNGSRLFTNPFILDSSLLDGPDLLI